MKAKCDDWATAYDGSGFTIDLEIVPPVGGTLYIHRSLMNPRFFQQSPYVGENGLTINDDGYVKAEVNQVDYFVGPDGQFAEVDLNFVDPQDL